MATEIEETSARAESRAAGMFRALGHRNFLFFWLGAFLSNIGTWMQAAAQGWLVQQLTQSPFWLGLDTFMATVPGLFLTLLGGVFADIIDRKKMLLLTQVGAGLTALTLGLLVVTKTIHDAGQVWIVLTLSFVTGCCMSLAGPSFQSFIFDLVGREDLSNAIALNSTQFQLSRVVGPALAGVALAAFGMAFCFFSNALSYIAIVGALALVRFGDEKADAAMRDEAKTRHSPAAIWHELLEGFRYVKTRPRVWMLLLISSVTSFFGAPYVALVPYFAQNVLGLGEKGFATMLSVVGAGAFAGALTITFLGDFRRKGLTVIGGSLLFGALLVGFSLSTRVEVALAFLFGMGFSIVSSVAVINMLLQQLVTDQMRGRVMSMFILTFVGALPIGSILAGAVAQRFGTPHTLAAGGCIVALFAFFVLIGDKRLRDA